MVVGLIGIIASIAIPLFVSYREKAQITVCISGIKVIEKGIILHMTTEDEYPNSLADIGLDDLRDPWGNPYQYTRIAGSGTQGKGKLRKDHFMVPINTDFDLYSMGPDGKSQAPLTAQASRDDIIRANDGMFVGPVSQY